MGTVHVRIVDQSLPADSGAWLFKVDPHDQQQLIIDSAGKFSQTFGIFEGRLGIVYGTGTDDHHQPLVPALDDLFYLLTTCADKGAVFFRNGKYLA